MPDPSPCGFDVSGLGLPHQVFEFGEHLLDGIEVGAVGRQEEQMRALGPDRGACGLALVTAEIVQNDDVARRERRGQDPLDVEQEQFALIGPSSTQGASMRS